MRFVLAYGVPILVIVMSVPMILGKVPPNGFYGFRTSKILSSPDIWYPANRVSGWFMTAAGVLTLVFNFMLMTFYSELPPNRGSMDDHLAAGAVAFRSGRVVPVPAPPLTSSRSLRSPDGSIAREPRHV